MTPIEVLKMLKSKIDKACFNKCNYAIETSDIEAINKMEKLKKILEAEIAQRKLAMKHNPLNKAEIAQELDELNIGLLKLFAIPSNELK